MKANGKRAPEYHSWSCMIQRCTNPNRYSWKYYGGRGITVCDRWLKFVDFLADMGARPPGTSLDRINNDGNYEPGNCRWATPKEQQANQRKPIKAGGPARIDISGKRYGNLVAIEFSHKDAFRLSIWRAKCDCGIVRLVAASSLRRGMATHCGCKEYPSVRMLSMGGKTLSLTGWERETGIKRATIYHRLRNGWLVKKALTTPTGNL